MTRNYLLPGLKSSILAVILNQIECFHLKSYKINVDKLLASFTKKKWAQVMEQFYRYWAYLIKVETFEQPLPSDHPSFSRKILNFSSTIQIQWEKPGGAGAWSDFRNLDGAQSAEDLLAEHHWASDIFYFSDTTRLKGWFLKKQGWLLSCWTIERQSIVHRK